MLMRRSRASMQPAANCSAMPRMTWARPAHERSRRGSRMPSGNSWRLLQSHGFSFHVSHGPWIEWQRLTLQNPFSQDLASASNTPSTGRSKHTSSMLLTQQPAACAHSSTPAARLDRSPPVQKQAAPQPNGCASAPRCAYAAIQMQRVPACACWRPRACHPRRAAG